jgi:thioredoxin-related protein
VSVLKKPEVTAQFSKHYLAAHADFGELELDDKDPLHEMVKRHNPRKLRPVLVFLDGAGKEVARLTGGLKTVEDALLLDRYVAEKAYLKGGDFAAFRKAQKG